MNLENSFKIRVLVVDDNEVFLQAAISFLQRQSGLVVLGTVCRDAEVIQQAQEWEPQIILVGLDGLGLGTISCLRKMMPTRGIIALTLVEGHAYRQAVLDAGADALVSKTNLATDLLPVIRGVARPHRSM